MAVCVVLIWSLFLGVQVRWVMDFGASPVTDRQPPGNTTRYTTAGKPYIIKKKKKKVGGEINIRKGSIRWDVNRGLDVRIDGSLSSHFCPRRHISWKNLGLSHLLKDGDTGNNCCNIRDKNSINCYETWVHFHCFASPPGAAHSRPRDPCSFIWLYGFSSSAALLARQRDTFPVTPCGGAAGEGVCVRAAYWLTLTNEPFWVSLIFQSVLLFIGEFPSVPRGKLRNCWTPPPVYVGFSVEGKKRHTRENKGNNDIQNNNNSNNSNNEYIKKEMVSLIGKLCWSKVIILTL